MCTENDIIYYNRDNGYTVNYAGSMVYFLCNTEEENREDLFFFILDSFNQVKDNSFSILQGIDGRNTMYLPAWEQERRKKIKKSALKYLLKYQWDDINPENYKHFLYECIFYGIIPRDDIKNVLDGVLIGHITLEEIIQLKSPS